MSLPTNERAGSQIPAPIHPHVRVSAVQMTSISERPFIQCRFATLLTCVVRLQMSCAALLCSVFERIFSFFEKSLTA
jgi:hypothetical protein